MVAFTKRMRIWSGSCSADLELEEEEQRENGAHLKRRIMRRGERSAILTLIREQTHEAWGWAPI